jgi:hypothetical protein
MALSRLVRVSSLPSSFSVVEATLHFYNFARPRASPGWSGHGEYLGKEKSGLIDSGPVTGVFRTVARYEAFIREGAKLNYRAEWHPGDGAPFLGPERFVKEDRERNNSAAHLPGRVAEGFAKARGGQIGTSRRHIASQGTWQTS